jgi:hypothetical protein
VTTDERPGPPLLGVGRVDPALPGYPWWRYRRAEVPTLDAGPSTTTSVTTSGATPAAGVVDVLPDEPATVDDTPRTAAVEMRGGRSDVALVIAALALVVVLMAAARQETTWLGSFLVPVIGFLLFGAAAARASRRHPDEPWIGRWFMAAVAAKLLACYFRYLTIVVGYENGGDAPLYHKVGTQLAREWMGGVAAPPLDDLRRTNFVRWFTGVVTYTTGFDFLAGFFTFGLLALAGSYFWYRATAEAVPIVDKKLYFLLVMFAPSVAFWPASIGKEALMQLGIGALSLGVARLFMRRLAAGLVIGLAGGWLVWIVRPHLLAIVAVAGGFAYIVGRVKKNEGGFAGLMSRPVGILVVAVLVGFAIGQGANYLGLEDLSLSSIETELNEQTERTAQGGSEFDSGDNSLSPIELPYRTVTVLMRPFPWEVETGFQLIASLESALLVLLIVVRFSSIRASLRHARTTPFLLYCWVLTLIYCAAYAAFSNFGLLVRQRSLVFPAVFVILAVNPLLAKRADRRALARASETGTDARQDVDVRS